MRNRTIAALFLSALLTESAVRAATTNSRPYREFVDSCVEAFTKSSGSDAEAAGKKICECTSKESKFQGVSVSALKKETAKIKSDPAYRIQDENLMNAFRWCTIQAMRDRAEPVDRARTMREADQDSHRAKDRDHRAKQ